jgi:hypothetical protein
LGSGSAHVISICPLRNVLKPITRSTSSMPLSSAAIPVTATNSAFPSQVINLPSYSAAAKFILDTNKDLALKVDSSTIRKYIEKGRPLAGWCFKKAGSGDVPTGMLDAAAARASSS